MAAFSPGFPVTDVKATVTDGSYHDVDSSEIAFKMAGIFAFKDAFRKASPILLEPIMKVEVVVPDEYMGDIIVICNHAAVLFRKWAIAEF